MCLTIQEELCERIQQWFPQNKIMYLSSEYQYYIPTLEDLLPSELWQHPLEKQDLCNTQSQVQNLRSQSIEVQSVKTNGCRIVENR